MILTSWAELTVRTEKADVIAGALSPELAEGSRARRSL